MMDKAANDTNETGLLSRDAILAAEDLPRELVAVPEWHGHVYVRALSGAERDRYESSMIITQTVGGRSLVKPTLENAKAKLAVLVIVDAGGKRLFTDAEVLVLGKKSAAALNRIVEVANRLSGISQDDIEELEKN